MADIFPESFIKSPTPLSGGVRSPEMLNVKSIGLNSMCATAAVDHKSGNGQLKGATSANNTEFLGS